MERDELIKKRHELTEQLNEIDNQISDIALQLNEHKPEKVKDIYYRWYNLSHIYSNEIYSTYFFFRPTSYEYIDDNHFCIKGQRFLYEQDTNDNVQILIDDEHEITYTDEYFDSCFKEENAINAMYVIETIHRLLNKYPSKWFE